MGWEPGEVIEDVAADGEVLEVAVFVFGAVVAGVVVAEVGLVEEVEAASLVCHDERGLGRRQRRGRERGVGWHAGVEIVVAEKHLVAGGVVVGGDEGGGEACWG